VLILADVNFGRALIGAQPQHSAQQAAPANVGLDQAYQARNAETWEADLSPLATFRLPDGGVDAGGMGGPRYGQASPQLPGKSLVFCF
jgi:hypothetical protein